MSPPHGSEVIFLRRIFTNPKIAAVHFSHHELTNTTSQAKPAGLARCDGFIHRFRFEDGGSAVSGARKNCRKPCKSASCWGEEPLVYGLTSWFSRLKFLCDFRPPGTSQLLPGWMTWW